MARGRFLLRSCSSREARPNTVRGNYGRVQVSFIGRNELIRNKSATSRAKDKADVKELM